MLIGWAGGPAGAALAGRGDAAVLRAALASLSRLLGAPARSLEETLDGATVADWPADPLARGAYAVFTVGGATAADELARPIAGTLSFAGEATDPGHAGTVHGALASGERAAREVLAALAGR